MTANNSFKKQVRLRMKLTGEPYTVARRKIYVPQGVNSLRPLSSLFEDADLLNLNRALIASKSSGVIVSSGPMYSGKTATVNAILNELQNAYVTTVEDPVETRFTNPKNVSQIAVKDTQGTLDGITYALRSRSTHIFLGEARNVEETDMLWHAGRASQAFTTLHADNSLATVVGRLRGDTSRSFFDYRRLTAVIQHKMVETDDGLFVLRAVIPNSPWVTKLLASEHDETIETGLEALGIRTIHAKLEASIIQQ